MIYCISLKSSQVNQVNIDDLGGSHNLDFDGNFEGVMMFDSQNNHNDVSNQLQHSIHHDFNNLMKWMNHYLYFNRIPIREEYPEYPYVFPAPYSLFFVRITKRTGNKVFCALGFRTYHLNCTLPFMVYLSHLICYPDNYGFPFSWQLVTQRINS